MTDRDDPEHGITYARVGLGAGAMVSIAGNVANTCLTRTDVHVALRIPGAVVWPLFLFLAIEVMVRNRHRTTKLGYFGRLLLMSVSVTTFTTSFVNLNGFMIKTHEPWIATITGPIGIDGLMLGCTVFLLAATLRLTADAQPERVSAFQYARPIGPMLAPVSVSIPEPVSVSAPRERAARPVSTDQEGALKMLMSGASVKEASENSGVSRPTVQRIKLALTALMSDRHADVSAQKLRSDFVDYMRREVATR